MEKNFFKTAFEFRKLKFPGSAAHFDGHFWPSLPPKGGGTALPGCYAPAARPAVRSTVALLLHSNTFREGLLPAFQHTLSS